MKLVAGILLGILTYVTVAFAGAGGECGVAAHLVHADAAMRGNPASACTRCVATPHASLASAPVYAKILSASPAKAFMPRLPRGPHRTASVVPPNLALRYLGTM